MPDLYDILEDEKSWIRFDGDGDGDICVYCRCPECGKYITRGKCLGNGNGVIVLVGFKCFNHGELTPFWIRD